VVGLQLHGKGNALRPLAESLVASGIALTVVSQPKDECSLKHV
jgi:hypothetical protein